MCVCVCERVCVYMFVYLCVCLCVYTLKSSLDGIPNLLFEPDLKLTEELDVGDHGGEEV